jgi:predicted helicase
MPIINLKPTHKAVAEYHNSLHTYGQLGLYNEGTVSPPFAILLESAARQVKWNLVQQYQKKVKSKNIRIDGAVVDQWGLPHGYWEAKDEKDDLRKEIKKKFAVGYPSDNIIFQEPSRAILVQNNAEIGEFDLLKPDELVRLLELFFEYQPPAFEEWEQAAAKFHEQLPELSRVLLKVIDDSKINNKKFQKAFADFYELCRSSINPNLSEKAVEEMLIQHLLTERIFRTVFNNSDFTKRNVIAREIENVILALTSQSFSRDEFLKRFDHFYRALEQTALTIESFSEKQAFLNHVYERFFQGFSVKVADTHGIVYTPQPIVNFMVKSVEEILQKEFGKSLSDENVHILDPFTGTGNFIVRIIDEIKRTSLEHKYRKELHCNEVMLLPYYIASMNIEHVFFEMVGRYEPFEGICLVDTFDMAEHSQRSFAFMTEENSARIQRQKNSPITVVIGNPPYNVGQVNENDNNKNRVYPVIEERVRGTYIQDSKARLKSKYSDPYIKAIRWASDRINGEGVIAFVTNSGFVHKNVFDGIRKHIIQDFDHIYVMDLGGSVKDNPKLSGTIHNVFGIKPGVCISFLVRHQRDVAIRTRIHYARLDEYWRKEKKLNFLADRTTLSQIEWQDIESDADNNWITDGMTDSYRSLVPLYGLVGKSIFEHHSLGVSTNRDETAYDFRETALKKKVHHFAELYNAEVHRYAANDKPNDVDSFVNYDGIKWSRNLKRDLKNLKTFSPDQSQIRSVLRRPFSPMFIYFSDIVVDEMAKSWLIFPGSEQRDENRVIFLSHKGFRAPFSALMTDRIGDLHLCASEDGFTGIAFYKYSEDGQVRYENIGDWAVEQFRNKYRDSSITKWDIFFYIYGMLNNPEYREIFGANLRRELPRIPLAPDFFGFAQAGRELADIHVKYEDQPEYKLEMIENDKLTLDWRVEKMRYNKDKTAIIYNDFLTLGGIPQEVHEYRLGSRSALDWIVDQYKVSTDKRSGITNDPNREDDPKYIVRLIKKIVTVSLRTNEIVRGLPSLSS